MKTDPLSREEVIAVIEGKATQTRVPNLVQFWVHPEEFGAQQNEVLDLLDRYPMDAQAIPFNIPTVFDAPADDPEYRWVNFKNPREGETHGIDEIVAIEDWDAQLEGVLTNFPNPDYENLFPENPESDGRYRLGYWWYFFFERFWSLRGMTNSLMDFYEYPDEVHELFDKLADFYCRMLERAKNELNLDGVFFSDDLGTQANTFFNPDLFDEFFAPYYKRVIGKAHELGMHFWLHSCGNIEKIIPKLIEAGVDVLHPIQKYTMEEKNIADQFGKDLCIWAGFDVQQTIPWGTTEEVREEVRFLIDTYARPEGRLMITAGNGINADCPIPSLEALLDETVKYGSAT